MKYILVFLIIHLACGFHVLSIERPNEAFTELWNQFKTTYQKQYEDSSMEITRRMIWEYNLRYINKHNREFALGKHSYDLGLNEYCDLTHEEFKKYMLPRFFNITTQSKGLAFLPSTSKFNLPEPVDWRSKGYVTEVKNQGQCGSCWAFASTGSLEGQHFRYHRTLVSLSEQQLVDCSASYGNHGCQGGQMDFAFEYIKAAGGIESERAYPYRAYSGQCIFDRASVRAKVSGFVDIPSKDEVKLQEAVATVGPIAVAMDASHASFQMYRSGVYNPIECSETVLDHGVLVAGYGRQLYTPYWLVKNSWGTGWGMQGYFLLARNMHNKCGVATKASYPLI